MDILGKVLLYRIKDLTRNYKISRQDFILNILGNVLLNTTEDLTRNYKIKEARFFLEYSWKCAALYNKRFDK